MTESPPTIAERYATATETSNMRVTEAPCPADVILAAAFSGEPVGALFQRLRSEFDQAKAEVRHEAAGQGIGVANERMLVMMRMRSLKMARDLVLVMADSKATRRGFSFRGDTMRHLAWQALSAWLDPRCSPCGGTGVIGGYDGAPQLKCKRCNMGDRRGFVGKTDAEIAFVDGLVGEIGDAITRFEAGARAALRR